MGWTAILTPETRYLLADPGAGPATRGSLVIETRMPVTKRPLPLLRFRTRRQRPFCLSLMAVPGGGLTWVVDRDGEVSHCAVNHSEAGRTDILRVTYSWDTKSRRARLAVERSDQERVIMAPVAGPVVPSPDDLSALCAVGADLHFGADVLYCALSDRIEPVGPMPSLHPDTPVATPSGYRPIRDLRRGDTVLTAAGDAVPVLHRIARQVPAFGSFAPVRVRAPFFGLLADLHTSPSQHLVLSGSDVEYLFGHEAVLVPVRHLVGGSTTRPEPGGPLATYMQLLLPGHEALMAAGTEAESLYIGRLRRKKAELSASLLAGADRSRLPEHGASVYPVLRPYDALVLADRRAA